jgi:hypothetical protein
VDGETAAVPAGAIGPGAVSGVGMTRDAGGGGSSWRAVIPGTLVRGEVVAGRGCFALVRGAGEGAAGGDVAGRGATGAGAGAEDFAAELAGAGLEPKRAWGAGARLPESAEAPDDGTADRSAGAGAGGGGYDRMGAEEAGGEVAPPGAGDPSVLAVVASGMTGGSSSGRFPESTPSVPPGPSASSLRAISVGGPGSTAGAGAGRAAAEASASARRRARDPRDGAREPPGGARKGPRP